jgi:hypothetical protein
MPKSHDLLKQAAIEAEAPLRRRYLSFTIYLEGREITNPSQKGCWPFAIFQLSCDILIALR